MKELWWESFAIQTYFVTIPENIINEKTNANKIFNQWQGKYLSIIFQWHLWIMRQFFRRKWFSQMFWVSKKRSARSSRMNIYQNIITKLKPILVPLDSIFHVFALKCNIHGEFAEKMSSLINSQGKNFEKPQSSRRLSESGNFWNFIESFNERLVGPTHLANAKREKHCRKRQKVQTNFCDFDRWKLFFRNIFGWPQLVSASKFWI